MSTNFFFFFRCLGRACYFLSLTRGAAVCAFACILWKCCMYMWWSPGAACFEVVEGWMPICLWEPTHWAASQLGRRLWCDCVLCGSVVLSFVSQWQVCVKGGRVLSYAACPSSDVWMWTGLYRGKHMGPAKAENWCLWCRYWRKKKENILLVVLAVKAWSRARLFYVCFSYLYSAEKICILYMAI